MGWKRLRPSVLRAQGEYTADKVRVNFPILKDTKTGKLVQYMLIYIGRYKAKEYGLNFGDRINIEIDDFNPLIWRIVKSGPEEKLSWKISKQGIKGDLRIAIKWTEEVPKGWGVGTKFASVSQDEGWMKLILPGAMELEQELLNKRRNV